MIDSTVSMQQRQREATNHLAQLESLLGGKSGDQLSPDQRAQAAGLIGSVKSLFGYA